MIRILRSRRAAALTVAIAIASALAGCASQPAPTPTVSPTVSPTPTDEPDEPRFIIECVGVDGTEIGPFTRLEEAWASTDYVRIDECEAHTASDDVELTAQEEDIATTAAEDVPGSSPTELFLQVLAACVRVPDEELTELPDSMLSAALELCPEAPQAGQLSAELDEREQG